MSNLPFGPYCPSGGTFYVCSGPSAKSKFVGCCAANPCGTTAGCSAGNLQPASFNSSAYGTFADQECSAGLFYTCTGTSPPFLGCCKSNPCAQKSCPQTDLAGMFLSNDPLKAGDFLPASAKSSAASSAATSLASKTASSSSDAKTTGTSTGTSAPQITIETKHDDHHLSTGALVGIAVAAVAVILALTGALFFVCGKRAKEKKLARKATFELLAQQDQGLSPPMDNTGFRNSVQKAGFSPYTGAYAPIS